MNTLVLLRGVDDEDLKKRQHTFIDLFAGYGGLSLGMEHAGDIRGINGKAFVNGKKDISK